MREYVSGWKIQNNKQSDTRKVKVIFIILNINLSIMHIKKVGNKSYPFIYKTLIDNPIIYIMLTRTKRRINLLLL